MWQARSQPFWPKTRRHLAAAYAASKAGLARFAETLRIGALGHGVSVTLVSPGFIDTAAGRALPGARPMAISAEEAADRIVRAAMAGKAHLVAPYEGFGGHRLILATRAGKG